MNGIALPNGSQASQAQAIQAAVGNLKITLARQIYTEMIADDYQLAKAEARREANPMGLDAAEPESVKFNIDLFSPAQLSLAAADAFLIAAGLARPKEPELSPKAADSPIILQ